MDEPVTFATFDKRLWEAAGREGLLPYPDELTSELAVWSQDQ